jgi:hypothetical protein
LHGRVEADAASQSEIGSLSDLQFVVHADSKAPYLPHEAMFNDQANAGELVRFVDGIGDAELGEGRAAYEPAGQPKYPQSLVLKR